MTAREGDDDCVTDLGVRGVKSPGNRTHQQSSDSPATLLLLLPLLLLMWQRMTTPACWLTS